MLGPSHERWFFACAGGRVWGFGVLGLAVGVGAGWPGSCVSGLSHCRVASFSVSGLLGLAFFFITISHCAWRHGRIQLVVATPITSASLSAGVIKSRVLRGLPFRSAATLFNSACEYPSRRVPLGKYCRSRPFVFSL